jgi:rubrerythrin
MLDQTLSDLAMAFALESRAAARYETSALKANQEGRAQEALFFRAAAKGQSVAAKRLLMLLRGKIGSTDANLAQAFEEELPQRMRTYADFQDRAEGPALNALKQVLDVGCRQEEFHQRLKKGETGSYKVCTICGCLLPEGHLENCPVCGAIPEKIEAVA